MTGVCVRCSAPFIAHPATVRQRYCSTRCRNRAARDRYRGVDIAWTAAERDRFLAKLDLTSFFGCWIWTGGKDADGYGLLRIRNQPWRAHRLAYTQVVGAIPDGLTLDHLCRTPSCVSPLHLEPVTNRENILRSKSGCNSEQTAHAPRAHAGSKSAALQARRPPTSPLNLAADGGVGLLALSRDTTPHPTSGRRRI